MAHTQNSHSPPFLPNLYWINAHKSRIAILSGEEKSSQKRSKVTTVNIFIAVGAFAYIGRLCALAIRSSPVLIPHKLTIMSYRKRVIPKSAHGLSSFTTRLFFFLFLLFASARVCIKGSRARWPPTFSHPLTAGGYESSVSTCARYRAPAGLCRVSSRQQAAGI